MALQALSKGERRRDNIMNVLKANGRITVQEITTRFLCSEATARRDLDFLEASGMVIRTIGGARLEGINLSKEASFAEKRQLLLHEKEAIAEKAASLVEAGDIVGLSGGTTTYLIAKKLKLKRGITVVTNAVNIAMELAGCEGIQLVLTGGVLRSQSYELYGPMAEKSVEGLNISKMFIGIDGLTIEQGITTFSEDEAKISALMIHRSRQTIAVFDHTKAGKVTTFSIAPLSVLSACITDSLIEPVLIKQLQTMRIPLYIAEPPEIY